MTNLSDLFPAGAGKQVSFTASGNVTSSGKPVVLNSDGTVSGRDFGCDCLSRCREGEASG